MRNWKESEGREREHRTLTPPHTSLSLPSASLTVVAPDEGVAVLVLQLAADVLLGRRAKERDEEMSRLRNEGGGSVLLSLCLRRSLFPPPFPLAHLRVLQGDVHVAVQAGQNACVFVCG